MSKNAKKLLLAVTVLILALAAVLLVGQYLQDSGPEEARSVGSDGFGRYERLTYRGQEYIKRTDVTVILLMGIDLRGQAEGTGFRSGGQNDFNMLLVLDHTNKVIRRLQLDRDAVTDVEVLGILGKPIGHRQLQLCLAHGYGATQKDCCENAIQSIEYLLQGAVDIDLYATIRIDAIPIINAALGGVTVTVPEDMTSVDPAMTKGAVLKLNGQQAEYMVRSRITIGDGSNEARMTRQKVYIDAAEKLFMSRIKSSVSFFDTFLDDLGSNMFTNMTRGRMVNECNRAYKYAMQDIEYLQGTRSIGDDGHVVFLADEQFVIDWVLSTLYRLP